MWCRQVGGHQCCWVPTTDGMCQLSKRGLERASGAVFLARGPFLSLIEFRPKGFGKLGDVIEGEAVHESANVVTLWVGGGCCS